MVSWSDSNPAPPPRTGGTELEQALRSRAWYAARTEQTYVGIGPVGVRAARGGWGAASGPGKIYVELSGVRERALEWMGRFSTDGYYWAGGGPPAWDTAQSILWDALRVQPPAWLYQEFATEFVARWDMRQGECWRLPLRDVLRFVMKQLVDRTPLIIGEGAVGGVRL